MKTVKNFLLLMIGDFLFCLKKNRAMLFMWKTLTVGCTAIIGGGFLHYLITGFKFITPSGLGVAERFWWNIVANGMMLFLEVLAIYYAVRFLVLVKRKWKQARSIDFTYNGNKFKEMDRNTPEGWTGFFEKRK